MSATCTENDVETRVRELAPLVARLAQHRMASVPASVEIDDLIQAGMMGLLDAAGRYQPSNGAQFQTYAVQRIRGAMTDELRECDYLPRDVRRKLRQVEATISRLEQQTGRAATEAEVASSLDISLADYQRLLQNAGGYRIVSYDDFSRDDEDSFLERYAVDHAADPLAMLEERSLRETLVAGIERLPEREKTVMGLYYEQELSLREIGQVLGVTESRVCQIHTQAVARLRATLKEAFAQ
jgi:RNA polymerase sigma factor FliA